MTITHDALMADIGSTPPPPLVLTCSSWSLKHVWLASGQYSSYWNALLFPVSQLVIRTHQTEVEDRQGGGSGPGGVSAPGEVCSQRGGVCSREVSAPGEGIPACTEADPLPSSVDRITDACKNITLAQLRCGR